MPVMDLATKLTPTLLPHPFCFEIIWLLVITRKQHPLVRWEHMLRRLYEQKKKMKIFITLCTCARGKVIGLSLLSSTENLKIQVS